MQSFAFSNNVFENNGYLPRRSTCLLLLECQYNWCLALDYSIVAVIIFIDFTKAFDVAPYRKLIMYRVVSLGE